MKLIDALKISQTPLPDGSQSVRLVLACGFTPLHLQTFLTAQLRTRMPGCRLAVRTGLFGDLVGNLERLDELEADALAVAFEWADLDPRLGVRTLGGWRPDQIADIVSSAEMVAGRIRLAVEAIARSTIVVMSLPTLALPPAFTTRPLQSAPQALQLQRIVSELAESLARSLRVRFISSQKLAEISVPASRYDIKSDLQTGFPYSLHHASVLAEMMADLIENRPPMKGLITDLDDTLWRGIVGEDGVDKISWDLNGHAQMHGLYQQFLSSLAAAGVLIGVASKNDAGIVAQAFERRDLLLSKESVFPFEVHWGSKSQSVRRIVDTWNISPDAVVFIDDNLSEVAEVQAVFPDMCCKVFPKNDPAAIWSLLPELRDMFGKSVVTQEDAFRLSSIRNADKWRTEGGSPQAQSDEFLRLAEARICFERGRNGDGRAFELVNKTNQFNLNGKRYSEAEWRQILTDPNAFLVTAEYTDKFGSLGKISVLIGTIHGKSVQLRTWVMSCRAFSRRIEHQCIRYLFDEMGADRITFDFSPTTRNGPMQEFLTPLSAEPLTAPITLTKEQFISISPNLFHRVEVTVHA